jgi:two-component SAPR family response regulator
MGAVSSRGKPRILIVEDQILFALHVADIVEDMGCEPIGPVGSVSAGLPLARHENIDAALLDIHLIDQTVKPIADVLESRAIPFAFMTAYTRLHLPAAHRARPFLCKPVTDDQLRMAITLLIGG